jgi:hypothetical protein
MAHAALERMVDFIGSNASRAATPLRVKFQNVINRGSGGEKLFADSPTTRYTEMDVTYHRPAGGNAAWAEFNLKGFKYKSESDISSIQNNDTWVVKAFSPGQYIDFHRGDNTVLKFSI